MIIKSVDTAIITKMYWFAAREMLIAINKSRYIICSVSLMAFLNLTTDNAPTKPRDKTTDDLMILKIKKIETENKIKNEEKNSLLLIALEYLL